MGFLSDIVDSITGRSATRAADRVAEGNQAAIDEMRRQFDIGVDLTGTQRGLQDDAATSLSALLGLGGEDQTAQLRGRPGYQFAVNEAIRNQNAGAAGRGQFFSGAAGEALQGNLYGLADQNYNSEINRLLAAANGGQAAQATANAGNQMGANVGGLMANTGAARASGILGRSNQINTMLNGVGRMFGTGFGG